MLDDKITLLTPIHFSIKDYLQMPTFSYILRSRLHLFLICLSVVACCSVPEAFAKADFYVSPDGSDAWSGSLAKPNGNRTDGPFATLNHARSAVRKLRRDRPAGDVEVLIRGGRYEIAETVVFGLDDSGSADTSVTYSAYLGEKPVFSSGEAVTGWRLATGSLEGLPKAAQGKVWVADLSRRIYTLYDAEGLLPRARTAGFVPREDGKSDRLYFPPGALKNWPNLSDVDIVIRPHHAWIVNILPLASVNEKTGVARTAIKGTYALNEQQFLGPVASCWVENVLEAIDQPGEWVLNTKEGKLYLWPRSDGAPTRIVAPRLRELIRIEGAIDKKGATDKPVRNLIFRGLTFMHGETYRIQKGDAGLQHDWDFLDRDNAMVRLRGAENCVVEHCHFLHGGGGGIRVDLHGQKNVIANNHIEHLGGAGILLAGYGPGTKDVNTHNQVYNNHIHHIGKVYGHSPGIMIWQSGENRIANNLIHHTPYAGVVVSGVMTHFFEKFSARELGPTIRWHEIPGKLGKRSLEQVRPFLHTHDNMVEYNEIHHAMQELADGNAIYIRGAGAGNVIRRNYIHHLVAPTMLQAAIRTDGGQRDTLIAENLIYKCMSQGIILKLNNRAENNFIIDVLEPTHKGKSAKARYLSLREGPMNDAVVSRNIFYHSGGDAVFYDQQKGKPRGQESAPLKDVKADRNIYYLAGNPTKGRNMLAGHKRDGVDANSLAVDPLFINPETGDFRFKPDSPAITLGIVPINLTKIGLLPVAK